MTDAPAPAWRFDLGNRLGECVLWDDRTQTMHWTDIEAAAFWSWPFGALAPTSAPVADRLASFGLTDVAGEFVGAFAKEFATFVPQTGTHRSLAQTEPGNLAAVMNDGRTDRWGTFWASSKMVDPHDGAPSACLWRLGSDATVSQFLSGMRVPNSLAWSLDGRTMYLSDSESRIIWRFAFDPERGPSQPSVFAQVVAGKPDGACIDAHDHLWVAHWGAGRIVRYRPDGVTDCQVDIPAHHPTCVAFGGPGLEYLVVTSERPDRDAVPADGSLLVYRTAHVGVAEVRCTALPATTRSDFD